jgi:hypothetical protein
MIITEGETGNDNNRVGDTWDYNVSSETWSFCNASGGPCPRFCQSAVYDGNGNMIIFGGNTAANGGTNDVWKYNIATTNWTALNSTYAPACRVGCGAILVNGSMIIFCGDNAFETFYNDV